MILHDLDLKSQISGRGVFFLIESHGIGDNFFFGARRRGECRSPSAAASLRRSGTPLVGGHGRGGDGAGAVFCATHCRRGGGAPSGTPPHQPEGAGTPLAIMNDCPRPTKVGGDAVSKIQKPRKVSSARGGGRQSRPVLGRGGRPHSGGEGWAALFAGGDRVLCGRNTPAGARRMLFAPQFPGNTPAGEGAGARAFARPRSFPSQRPRNWTQKPELVLALTAT